MTLEKREKLKALIKMVNQKGETFHTWEVFFFLKVFSFFFGQGLWLVELLGCTFLKQGVYLTLTRQLYLLKWFLNFDGRKTKKKKKQRERGTEAKVDEMDDKEEINNASRDEIESKQVKKQDSTNRNKHEQR